MTTLTCLVLVGIAGCGGSPTDRSGQELDTSVDSFTPGTSLRHTHVVRLSVTGLRGRSGTTSAARARAAAQLAALRSVVIRADAVATVERVEPDGSQTLSVEAFGTAQIQGSGRAAVAYTYDHRLGVDGSSDIQNFAIDLSQLAADRRHALSPVAYMTELALEAHFAGVLMPADPDSSIESIAVTLMSSPKIDGTAQPPVRLPAAVTLSRRTAVGTTFTTQRMIRLDATPLWAQPDVSLRGGVLRGAVERTDGGPPVRSGVHGAARADWRGAGTFTVRIASALTSLQSGVATAP